jgi:hypothetical protein
MGRKSVVDHKLTRRDVLAAALTGIASLPLFACTSTPPAEETKSAAPPPSQPAAPAETPAAAAPQAPEGAAGTAAATGDHLPHITEQDAQAVAFHYVHDATKVDKSKNPTFQAGSSCENCLQTLGKAGEDWRPCKVIPGKLVNAKGWCMLWAKQA